MFFGLFSLCFLQVSFVLADCSLVSLCMFISFLLPERFEYAACVVRCLTRPLKVRLMSPRASKFLMARVTVGLLTPYSNCICSLDLKNDEPFPVNDSISANNAFSTNDSSWSNQIWAGIHTPLNSLCIAKNKRGGSLHPLLNLTFSEINFTVELDEGDVFVSDDFWSVLQYPTWVFLYPILNCRGRNP